MRAGYRHASAPPGRGGAAWQPDPGMVAAVERLTDRAVRAVGLELESVQLSSAGRRRLLRVVVDAVGGAGLDDIALVSQALSAELDAAGVMGEAPYTLEVTSPGVDRPLTRPEHWRRAVGRLVSVPRAGGPAAAPPGRHIHGRIITAGADGVVIEAGGERREFGFAELGPGKVQVEFHRDDMGESRGH